MAENSTEIILHLLNEVSQYVFSTCISSHTCMYQIHLATKKKIH